MIVERQEQQHLTASEQEQIESNIREDLVEHLYRSAPSGVTTVFLASTSVFIFFYQQAHSLFLISWLASFYMALFSIAILYWFYKKNKFKMPIQYWQQSLSFLLICCGLLWGSCLFFNPSDEIHQIALLLILFMVSAALSMATVGIFLLGCVCVFCILSPLTIWFISQNNFYYQSGGVIVILYGMFLLGMNYRSTQWLKNSLRLKIENTYFTYQANHDLLSGLPNQRMLSQRLENLIHEKLKFAIVCFSINRLEIFNNSLGYQLSDFIIQAVSKRLLTFFNEVQNAQKDQFHYFVAHPRSDSFIILIEPFKKKDLDKTLGQLFQMLESPFHIGKTATEVTASIGVSLYPKDGENAKAILSNTYAAMFQAKQQGGNQIKYYKSEMNEKTPYLLELENDLHHAVKRQELVLFYQPIIDLEDGSIAGMEALIRWQHPKYGIIPPLDFIFLAEENGMIVPIGKWVLRQACYQAAQWYKMDANRVRKISVNVSSKQLQEEAFLLVIQKTLKETGLHPECLELELTETAILDKTVFPLIKEIKKINVSLSIDDFGTGYSGLSYLRDFKIDTLKIDQSFVQEATNNDDSATIISAIIAMAKEMGLKIVAEGVENEDQLRFLLKRSCRYAQGYYFGRPMSAADFTLLLKTKTRYDGHILKAKIAN